MRRASQDMDWITSESGELLGINLGYDYCAEHEFGLKGLRHSFGLVNEESPKELLQRYGLDKTNPHVFGIEQRLIRELPSYLLFGKVKGPKRSTLYALICERIFEWHGGFEALNAPAPVVNGKRQPKKIGLPGELAPIYDEEKGMATAWAEGSFGILVTRKNKANLEELYEAFQRMDICIGLGRISNPFARGGLLLMIASRLPEEIKQAVYEADEDHFNLKSAAEATCIYEYLKEKGKRYFACSPSWANEEKTEVKFWLNPMEQKIHEYGWYTVEQLRQWGNNEGPVMSKKSR